MDFFESVLDALKFLVNAAVDLVELVTDFLRYLAEAVEVSSFFTQFIPAPLAITIGTAIGISVILKIISVKKGGI